MDRAIRRSPLLGPSRSGARSVEAAWEEPDRGIWEIRGEKRHFVFSKVLCWVAIDRAIKIAELLEKKDWAEKQRPLLNEIHESIGKRGWSEEKQAFVQSYGVVDLDASNLLLAEYGFLRLLFLAGKSAGLDRTERRSTRDSGEANQRLKRTWALW